MKERKENFDRKKRTVIGTVTVTVLLMRQSNFSLVPLFLGVFLTGNVSVNVRVCDDEKAVPALAPAVAAVHAATYTRYR